jgi:hypothetical protein
VSAAGRERAKLRQRLRRAREKAGLQLFDLELPSYEIHNALLNSGRLSDAEALRPRLVRKALVELLCDWAARWQEPPSRVTHERGDL